MTYLQTFVAATLLLVFFAAPVAVGAESHVNDCYLVPTQDKLVRVLTGAREVESGLVTDLTSGERWVLRTFFGLQPELLLGQNAELCGQLL